MQNFAVILISFLSAVTVMAQNEGLENINVEVNQIISEPEYNFEPEEGSPGVEVAPLAVNSEDQDVPLEPKVTEDVEVNVTPEEDESN